MKNEWEQIKRHIIDIVYFTAIIDKSRFKLSVNIS